jgi:hypothetical protein
MLSCSSASSGFRLNVRAKANLEFTTLNKRISSLLGTGLLGAGLLVTGFISGWVGSRHITIQEKSALPEELEKSQGDAPTAVRGEISRLLKVFQDGYTKRDPQQLAPFMQELFPRDKKILLLGTDAKEWVAGYDSISEFIEGDWTHWGDVRLDMESPIICSSGDVAWLAAQGVVIKRGHPRPIRFTAILALDQGKWSFRQVQFQWDERLATLRDLSHLKNYGRLRLH